MKSSQGVNNINTVTKGLVKGLEDLEIRGRVETVQTITLLRLARSPGDLRKVAVTQTLVKDYQLTLM